MGLRFAHKSQPRTGHTREPDRSKDGRGPARRLIEYGTTAVVRGRPSSGVEFAPVYTPVRPVSSVSK